MLYQKELPENKTDEELFLNIWYWKNTSTHQQILELISDRVEFLKVYEK